jgi:hypothetical protein
MGLRTAGAFRISLFACTERLPTSGFAVLYRPHGGRGGACRKGGREPPRRHSGLNFATEIYWRLALMNPEPAAIPPKSCSRARLTLSCGDVGSPAYAASGGAARWCSASAQELTIDCPTPR